MNAPLSLGMVMFAFAVAFSRQGSGVTDLLLILLFSAMLLLPFLLRSRRSLSTVSFHEQQHPFGKKFLAVHGLLFLTLLQPFALLWSAEYLMPHVTGTSHGVALMFMTVTAGSFAVAGEPAAVRSVSRWSAAGLSAIILLATVNAFFFHFPLYASSDRTILQLVPMSFTETFGISVAASLLMFWMNTLEMSATFGAVHEHLRRTAAVFGTVLTAGIVLFLVPAFAASESSAAYTSFIDTVISFGTIAGIGGLFAGSVSSAGVLVADRFFRDGQVPETHDKMRLVNKLAVVFSAIAAVLLIPIVRTAPSSTPEIFFALLAAFTSPVVAAFVITSVARKQRPLALSAGMLIGGSVAAAEFIMFMLDGTAAGEGLLLLTVAGAAGTAGGYAVIAVLQELVVVQRLLSMMRHS